MKALRQIIERVRENRDQAWALATLVETHGSTYRKPGARMLTDSDGGTIGVLSGGCLEVEIARCGREIIRGAAPVLLAFDMRRLYGCDGQLRILVERVASAGAGGNFLTELGARLERRQPCRLRTCYEGEALGTTLLAPAELVPERPGTFLHHVPLLVRLILFGTGPEIAPVRQFAQTLGWVIHHFTHASELPDDFQSDRQTAALVMAHNFGRDLAALDRLLPLQLPYVGLLGPRKRHRQLLGEAKLRTAPRSSCSAISRRSLPSCFARLRNIRKPLANQSSPLNTAAPSVLPRSLPRIIFRSSVSCMVAMGPNHSSKTSLT